MITVTSDGKIVAKILADLNGYNAKSAEQKIRECPTRDLDVLYRIALKSHFGTEGRLTVLGENGAFVHERDADPPESFFDSFGNPRHAPHCELGTAEYTKVVRLEACGDRFCESCGVTSHRTERQCPECGGEPIRA